QQQPRDLLGGTAIAEPPAEFPKMNLGESSIYQQLQAGGMNLYGRQPLPDPPGMTMPQAAPQNTPQQPAITPEMRAQINQFYADAQQQQQQRAQAQAAPQP